MYNLIVRSVEWDSDRESMDVSRMLEYTSPEISAQFKKSAPFTFDLDGLSRLPCLFMQEGTGDEVAYVGYINRAKIVGTTVSFEYVKDPDIPPLLNNEIYTNRTALEIPADFEFSRNHWAVKDIDLYRFLLRTIRPRRQRPIVFQIPEHEKIEASLVSVMMPFDPKLTPVFASIQSSASSIGLRCRRADDIWENAAIIQDVVSLIDRSRIVICDCSGRNPNVFYEAGIAHTLGREVILIAQNEQDIPFDLRHLRFIPYLNNEEGRLALASSLQTRMQHVIGH